ncbi:MAG: SDR family NAD(P)-dependent oxidoreductase [Beijerinckiaceae bacterium]|nr:SDR family NAD(P)-dependent oxidoreductase [Beijerinckiaceae bacterium]
MLDLSNRVILISGASRGIGRAIAEALYARGCRLSLGVRDAARLDDFSGGKDESRLHVGHYDAESWASHKDWVADAVDRFGQIDGLVNNAGISSAMTLRTADEAALDTVWAVNCKAPLNMIRETLPYLEKSGSGRIVNVASLSGKRVKNDNVAYAMSKFAVVALTHAVRRIGWEHGVRATALCPSFVATDMTAGSAKIAASEMSSPADIAELVATVMALPNTASVAELLVNCRLEDMV